MGGKKKKNVSGVSSSVMVSWAAIIALFLLSFIAQRFSLNGLGVMLSVLGFLGLVARLWSLAVLKNLDLTVCPKRTWAEIGERVTFSYTVENNKPLPVMWLEFCTKAPGNGCLEPEEGFTKGQFSNTEAEEYGFSEYYGKRLLFLMGFRALTWETEWIARRRGIYFQDAYFLRSGDGYGLSESASLFGSEARPVAVWPKIEPVSLDPFIHQAWLGVAGKRGHVEDITVLSGLRKPQPGDSWKRIDWRIAARQDELYIKVFDKVLPEKIWFFFDCASFMVQDETGCAAEEALSAIASVMTALVAAGLPCGLTLPETALSPQLELEPPDGALEDLMYALSAFDPASASKLLDLDSSGAYIIVSDQLWVVSADCSSPACAQLLETFEGGTLRLLTNTHSEISDMPALRFSDMMRDTK